MARVTDGLDGPRSLRERMARRRPLLAAGARDGLSALLVGEAGFDAVWSSGFEISASHGVPDANIVSMSDQLRAAAQMVERSGLPVIADCDNGFGNAINAIHTVRAFERAGVAAVCLEDNVFPKRCSFYAGVTRQLADAEEHAGKIRACLDARSDPDFQIIARTEALVAGLGMEEALRRARRYADVGADMLLVHSKASEPDEVQEFARRWDRTTPLVCVPTTYGSASARELGEAGYRLVIFANQGLRASIRAMRDVYSRLRAAGRSDAADELIAPLESVYELIGLPQLREDERSYLPAPDTSPPALVLAAGESPELGELTAERPKAMLEIRGRSLLARQVEALRAAGVRDVSVVVGWQKQAVDLPNLRRYEAPRGGEVASLLSAAPELGGRVLVLYGDVLFDPEIVSRLLRAEGDVVLVVDRADSDRKARDLVWTDHDVSDGGRVLRSHRTHAVRRIHPELERANGEWIGIALFSDAGAAALRRVTGEALEAGPARGFQGARSLHEASVPQLLQALIDADVDVRCIDTYQGWMEVNSFEDYRRAWAQVK